MCVCRRLRGAMAGRPPETRSGPFSRNTLTAAPPKKQQLPKCPPELDAKARASGRDAHLGCWQPRTSPSLRS